MSTAVTVNPRLSAITAAGTSIWLDQIRRSLVETGELARMVAEDSLRGLTSNPAIFEKAILGSPDYDGQLEQLAREGKTARECYRYIAVRDVQEAGDVLRSVYDDTQHYDGYVSLEVAPRLAHDTEGTIEQARLYWDLVDRPNLMIKIPGTEAGLPAIEQMIYEGRNINVTLLFSVEAYTKVTEAYIRGLERRHAEGKSLDIHSVASFFVSRVDSEVDHRLEKLGRTDLQGKAGLANARAAYKRFKEIFHGERFRALREAGAPVQRPLWASTGVKNPAYSETMYVDGLIGPETVNTMPMATLLAAAEHAEVHGATADIDPTPDLQALAEAGIDLDDVTRVLLEEGIAAFLVPMEKLLAGVESKREEIVTQRPPTIQSVLPDDCEPGIIARVHEATVADVARRIWKKDETLWGQPGQPEIANRLGWLTITDTMLEEVEVLEDFTQECRNAGLTDCVLLGMGGSSLAPEVIRRSFGEREGYLRLHVFDTTDAGALRTLESAIGLDTTLFIVATKSGGTIETLSALEYFWSKKPDGRHFIAITDPGTPLVDLAQERSFRRVFLNDPNIGGRYSALSYFGLVPAALMGADIRGLLDRAGIAEQASVSFDSTRANSGLWVGITIGELADHTPPTRDKLTFVVSEPLSSFGLWAEQLVAESTGKDDKGALPVADEPLGSPEAYGNDRTFVYLRNVDDPDKELDAKTQALAKAGHPLITLGIHGPTDLGRIVFFSMFATAVAGWVLRINPFDQPNVQEAKDNTAKVLAEYDAAGALPDVADAGDDELRGLLGGVAPPHYVAILGFVEPSDDFDAAVAELRTAIRDATTATTTFGYGPRYLHSTGQFHKGGPLTGHFLMLVHDSEPDVDVPGTAYTFNTLKNAQAIGDLRTLRDHSLPAERVRLTGDDPAAALRALTERIKGIL